MHILSDPQTWLTLLVLTALEIVLGIDNLVFLTIISNRLPGPQQRAARRLGLLLAMFSRLILLALAFALVYLTQAIFHIGDHGVSVRDIFLFLGGLFLIWKSIDELKTSLAVHSGHRLPKSSPSFKKVVVQIAILDIMFSFDSIITAVGVAKHYWVMATAIVIAILLMILASESLALFIKRFPRVRVLALCFLLLIGLILVVEGFGVHVPKAYVFIALGFSLFVEIMHIIYDKLRKK